MPLSTILIGIAILWAGLAAAAYLLHFPALWIVLGTLLVAGVLGLVAFLATRARSGSAPRNV